MIIFYFFVILSAVSALGVLLSGNVLYAALMLIVCLLGLAGIYVLLQAEFLAITQIMIYAGGVLVLLIFGIMLTIKKEGKPLAVASHHLLSGSLVGSGFLFLLSYSFATTDLLRASDFISTNNVAQTGVGLMSDYVAPFELAGVLLLITLVGSMILASVTKQG